MGVSYDLYNADPEYSDLSKWESDHFRAIGLPLDVISKIDNLLHPKVLIWEYSPSNGVGSPYKGHHSALESTSTCNIEDEYIDLCLTENEEGYICSLAARKASPKLLQLLMNEFKLKYAFELEGMSLVDPFLYKGNWQKID